ncbi:MAG: hypothetical protein IPK60_16895 [Sandaracinaceae bacterium]|nr:hypothetical protein [Sandaracinaceae bacterium]
MIDFRTIVLPIASVAMLIACGGHAMSRPASRERHAASTATPNDTRDIAHPPASDDHDTQRQTGDRRAMAETSALEAERLTRTTEIAALELAENAARPRGPDTIVLECDGVEPRFARDASGHVVLLNVRETFPSHITDCGECEEYTQRTFAVRMPTGVSWGGVRNVSYAHQGGDPACVGPEPTGCRVLPATPAR